MTDRKELETRRDALIAERARLENASKRLQTQAASIDDGRRQIETEAVERVLAAALNERSADLVDLAYRNTVLDLSAAAIPVALTRLQIESQTLAEQLRHVQLDLQELDKVKFQQRLKTTAQQVKTEHGTANRNTFFGRVRDAMNSPHITEREISKVMGWG